MRGRSTSSAPCERVPWARNCDAAVVLGSTEGGDVVLLLPLDRCTISEGHNLAHEPRDRVRFDLELPQRVGRAGPGRPGPGMAAARCAGQSGADLRSHGERARHDDRPRIPADPVRSSARQVPGGATPRHGRCRRGQRRARRVRGGGPDRRAGRDRESAAELAVAIAKSQAPVRPEWSAGLRTRSTARSGSPSTTSFGTSRCACWRGETSSVAPGTGSAGSGTSH